MNLPPILLALLAALLAPSVARAQESIVDNERVRVTLRMLGSSQSLPRHLSRGLLVAVNDAQGTFRTEGPDEAVALRSANFKWRDSDRPVVLVNRGQTVLRSVDIRLR